MARRVSFQDSRGLPSDNNSCAKCKLPTTTAHGAVSFFFLVSSLNSFDSVFSRFECCCSRVIRFSDAIPLFGSNSNARLKHSIAVKSSDWWWKHMPNARIDSTSSGISSLTFMYRDVASLKFSDLKFAEASSLSVRVFGFSFQNEFQMFFKCVISSAKKAAPAALDVNRRFHYRNSK